MHRHRPAALLTLLSRFRLGRRRCGGAGDAAAGARGLPPSGGGPRQLRGARLPRRDDDQPGGRVPQLRHVAGAEVRGCAAFAPWFIVISIAGLVYYCWDSVGSTLGLPGLFNTWKDCVMSIIFT